MTRHNARIARQLVRIARELVVADEENRLKYEIKKELEKENVDNDVQEEIDRMMRAGSVRVAVDGGSGNLDEAIILNNRDRMTLTDYLKKIAGWIKKNKLTTAIAVALICFMLHKYMNGGDATETVKSFISNLLEDGGLKMLSGAVISRFFKK